MPSMKFSNLRNGIAGNKLSLSINERTAKHWTSRNKPNHRLTDLPPAIFNVNPQIERTTMYNDAECNTQAEIMSFTTSQVNVLDFQASSDGRATGKQSTRYHA